MRNKQKDFPNITNKNLHPKAKAENHSLRPNGTINTQPQERMRQSEGDYHE
ncbi:MULTISPECIES: small acid-soluble spore protein K [Paraliobacillus]|uniref:small acid-soluble spore protein K n=1 Tax=Paraliobacillus TaxID=200903 RepID=UPI000DD30F48|nr:MULTISPECIES: small acid-soluble spore protein K [Paraliobacillus]